MIIKLKRLLKKILHLKYSTNKKIIHLSFYMNLMKTPVTVACFKAVVLLLLVLCLFVASNIGQFKKLNNSIIEPFNIHGN